VQSACWTLSQCAQKTLRLTKEVAAALLILQGCSSIYCAANWSVLQQQQQLLLLLPAGAQLLCLYSSSHTLHCAGLSALTWATKVWRCHQTYPIMRCAPCASTAPRQPASLWSAHGIAAQGIMRMAALTLQRLLMVCLAAARCPAILSTKRCVGASRVTVLRCPAPVGAAPGARQACSSNISFCRNKEPSRRMCDCAVQTWQCFFFHVCLIKCTG
jgi:hypothetical protein